MYSRMFLPPDNARSTLDAYNGLECAPETPLLQLTLGRGPHAARRRRLGRQEHGQEVVDDIRSGDARNLSCGGQVS